jgi:ribonuclease P protein component
VLPARHRLRTAADFTATVRGAGGARSGGRLLVLHARDRDPAVTAGTVGASGPRVGFVVSKAVGGAVTRNRTKRVLRHLVADRLPGIPPNVDLVVRANPASSAASTPQLAAELDRTLAAVLRKVCR